MFAACILLATAQTQRPSNIVLPHDPYAAPLSPKAYMPEEAVAAVRVAFYRPSVMAKMLNVHEPVELQADDHTGVLRISGWPQGVDQVRARLQSLDMPRRTVQLHVLVMSSSSNFRFEGDVKLLTHQRWTTIDGDTGAKVSLEANAQGQDSLVLSTTLSWKVPARTSAHATSVVQSTALVLRSGQTWTMPKSDAQTDPDLKVEVTPTVLDTPPPGPYQYSQSN